MDGRLWSPAAEYLSAAHRCILPDWPMGAHRVAMNADADLSLPGIANLIANFLEAKELNGVTIVGNDSGGAISQVLATRRPGAGRPAGADQLRHARELPTLGLQADAALGQGAGRDDGDVAAVPSGAPSPGGVRAVREGKIPPELIDSWMAPSQRDAGVRRDPAKVTAGLNKRYTLEAAERLGQFDRPTLFAWAPEDRFFKLSYAERLAETIPDAGIETIPDAKTFVPLDQPGRLADLIAAFIEETSKAPAVAGDR